MRGPAIAIARRTGTLSTKQGRIGTHPALVIVSIGSAIDFPNEDPFFHNVFSYSRPKRFDIGRYPRGESKRIVFDQPGTISVRRRC